MMLNCCFYWCGRSYLQIGLPENYYDRYILCSIVSFIVSQITVYCNIFHHLDDAFYHMASCRLQAGNLHTQTNLEESECDTTQRYSEQDEDSDQPR